MVNAAAGARAGEIAAGIHAAMHARTAENLQTMRVQFRWVAPSSDELLRRIIEAGLQ